MEVSQKLEKKFDGPFLITSKRSDFNFVIQLEADGESGTSQYIEAIYREKPTSVDRESPKGYT